ncbi:leucine-rich repeat extensin-like protein 3 [Quillaja saponaria]|uniref:Leucine-rich repeat extensin-like protein 3 n=1 Tax=Quillaja saponaria TaxID=32244 RepID=A0AAD7QEF3_QUISA|nr:leucine-rich repeat extensin-like protein 3 [Quillaja saponaria]
MFVFCLLSSTVKSQIGSCSAQNINLVQCMTQSNRAISVDRSCCTTLNQIVQTGFNCFCSLALSSSIDLLHTPLTLPFPNCYISIPPLSLCRVLEPMPVTLPPDSPKEFTQPSSPKDVLVPTPPNEVQVPPNNLTLNNSSSTVSKQPLANENGDPEVSVSKGGENTQMLLLCQTLLLSLNFMLVLN